MHSFKCLKYNRKCIAIFFENDIYNVGKSLYTNNPKTNKVAMISIYINTNTSIYKILYYNIDECNFDINYFLYIYAKLLTYSLR